jgi:hypothetical protein
MSAILNESRTSPCNEAENVCTLPENVSQSRDECESAVAVLDSAQAQPIDAAIEDSDRDPNAVVFCNVDRLTVRDIPLNARHVILDFYTEEDNKHHEPVVSEEMFDNVVNILAQRPAIRWLCCGSADFKNLSVSRVQKLLKANPNLFLEATTPWPKLERLTDDTVNSISKLSVDELRRVCFRSNLAGLEDHENVRNVLSDDQRSALAGSWQTNRDRIANITRDNRAWLSLTDEVRAELVYRADMNLSDSDDWVDASEYE